MKKLLVEPKFVEYLRINYPYVWRTRAYFYLPLFIVTTLVLYELGSSKIFTLQNASLFTFHYYGYVVGTVFIFISYYWIKKARVFPLQLDKKNFSQTFLVYFFCITMVIIGIELCVLSQYRITISIGKFELIKSDKLHGYLEKCSIKETEKKYPIYTLFSLFIDDKYKLKPYEECQFNYHSYDLKEICNNAELLNNSITCAYISKRYSQLNTSTYCLPFLLTCFLMIVTSKQNQLLPSHSKTVSFLPQNKADQIVHLLSIQR